MLLRFTVENYRCFRDEAAISFVATRATDAPNHRLDAPDVKHGVLPAVAIYGANASGKSNLLRALRSFTREITGSFVHRKPDGQIPYRPFALDSASRARPTTRSIDFVVDGVRYHFGFRNDAARIIEEWLYAYPQGRQQVWFHRTEGHPEEPIHFGPHLKGQKRLIETQTRPNSLFLSAAAQHNHEQLKRIYEWFSGTFAWLDGVSTPSNGHFQATAPLLAPRHAARVRELLRMADLGVLDFRAEQDEDFLRAIRSSDAGLPAHVQAALEENPPMRVLLAHESDAGPTFLRADDESHGTRRLLAHLNQVLGVLTKRGVLLVDELDAGLHPRLSAALLDLFTSGTSNPNRAQLLFTSHDTTLLRHLRRDEVVFTEKDHSGAARVVPLSEFDTRKRDDIERGYVEGRFGGVPMVGDLTFPLAAPDLEEE